MFHCKHAFTEKAQHLRRCISLRTFTRGRLVPRQPRAIKRTTRTELRGESIHSGRYIHRNINITPTALRCYNIQHGGYIHWNIGIKPTALCGYNIQNGRCVHWNISTFCNLFIRMLPSIVLWNARFNAVGIVLFRRYPIFIHAYISINHTMIWIFQRRRCRAFDSPGLPNDSAGYPGLAYVVGGTTP